MRTFSIAFVALLISYWPAHTSALAGPQAILSQKVFRPYGYFSMIGKPPKGFEDFDTIQYWQKGDEQSGPDISERLSGVNVSGGTVYRYATISVNRRNFIFTTRKIKGVSYQFRGRFLRTDFVEREFEPGRPVLTGKLSKYRDGKKVAEAGVRLSYFAGT